MEKTINDKLNYKEFIDESSSEKYETKGSIHNESKNDLFLGIKSEEKEEFLFKRLLEAHSEGIVITDIGGKIKWINPAFNKITGYSLEEIFDKTPSILKSDINNREFYKDMWSQLLNKGQWSGEIWNKNKEGRIYSEWLKITSIKDSKNNTTHYVGMFKDLSQKRKIDLRFSQLQQKDLLTGLYNRNHFLQLLISYIEKNQGENKEFAILLINIKDFKEVNNSLGHSVGDKLLINISEKLLELCGESHIVSRFGGDEFIVFYRSPKSKEEIINFCEKLLNHLNQGFKIKNTLLHVRVNIGVSIYPKDSLMPEELVKFANIAMHNAKAEISNNVVFYLDYMSKEIDERFLLVNQLVEAIDNKELSLRFQPIFDINDPEHIVCAEALLRWENSILGPVSPDKFIPILEKTGQIICIGQWVIEQVCSQINLWKCRGLNLVPISVNISVKQLEQENFAHNVLDILKKHNITPNTIELEITESVSSGDIYTITKNLKTLKEYGFKVAMDDFGTGFSSLGQLELFRLDKLKIDKIFLDDIVNISKKQKLVKAIIAMAKGLGLTVVAEGIETIEQLAYLRELQCELGQGYLVSKPLMTAEFEQMLTKSSY